MKNLVDCISISIQAYLLSRMMCNMLPVKEPKERSFMLAFFNNWLSCIATTYIFNHSPLEKITSGIITYIIMGLFIYNGGLIKKIGFGILQYGMLLGLGFLLQFVLFKEFVEVIKTLPIHDLNLLAKVLGTPMVFIICLGTEFWINRHQGTLIKMITGLGCAMAIVQWIILGAMFQTNAGGIIINAVTISFIFSTVLMVGYIVVMELYRAMIKRQEKKNELEQMRLETQQLYELYQQVLGQEEDLRNLRHDLKNQLQAIQYLITTENERERALQMLNELRNKINS